MRLHIPLIAMLLVALLAPHAAAAKCPELVVWAADDAEDVYELPANLNGGMDILELRVGQGGDACDRVLLGVTINDPAAVDPAAGSGAQDPDEPFNVGSQRVIVSPVTVDGEPVVQVHFIWGLRTHTDETAHQNWAVELYIDGAKVSDTIDGDNAKLSDEDDGGYMDASIDGSLLAGVTAWLGATARTSEWLHDAYAEHDGPGYGPDELTANETYTFGYGLGVPPAPEPEPEPEPAPTPAANETGSAASKPPAGGASKPVETPGETCADADCPAEHLDDGPQGKQSPGLGLPLVLALLGAFAVARLRRS